ncbi:MAG: transposase [Saprospiraceae bacterium]|nr:transposase [Candidatus Parvibacillus calidus]
MGQRMEKIGQGTRKSGKDYQSSVSYYQAKNCNGCPLLGMCHNAKGNRRIEVNHRLNDLKQKQKHCLQVKKE